MQLRDSKNVQMNIVDLSPGVYLMNIVSMEGTVTKRIIKKSSTNKLLKKYFTIFFNRIILFYPLFL